MSEQSSWLFVLHCSQNTEQSIDVRVCEFLKLSAGTQKPKTSAYQIAFKVTSKHSYCF